MNIDKFGRINATKSISNSVYEIEKLGKAIILLKSELIDITKTVNSIVDLIKRSQVEFEKDSVHLTIVQEAHNQK